MKADQLLEKIKPALGAVKPALENLWSKIPDSVKGSLSSGKKTDEPAGPVRVLACDAGAFNIILLEMEKSPDGVEIKHCTIIQRDKDKELSEQVKAACEAGGFETSKIRIAVKGQGVVVRFVRFPQMTPEELRGALTYEAENFIPFRTDEVFMDFNILDENIESDKGKEMNVLLVAVKRDEVYATIGHYQAAGVEVELVDMDILAAMNALEWNYPEDFAEAVGFLDIGTEISSLCVAFDGKPRFMRDISYGVVDITKRLRRKLGLTDEETSKILAGEKSLDEDGLKALQSVYENLVTDLRVSLDYYLDQVVQSKPIQKLFIAGGGSIHPAIADTLTRQLKIPTQSVGIPEKIRVADSVDVDQFKKTQGVLLVAMGLCLRDV